MRVLQLFLTAAAVATAISLAGCSDDGTGIPSQIKEFEGIWDYQAQFTIQGDPFLSCTLTGVVLDVGEPTRIGGTGPAVFSSVVQRTGGEVVCAEGTSGAITKSLPPASFAMEYNFEGIEFSMPLGVEDAVDLGNFGRPTDVVVSRWTGTATPLDAAGESLSAVGAGGPFTAVRRP